MLVEEARTVSIPGVKDLPARDGKWVFFPSKIAEQLAALWRDYAGGILPSRLNPIVAIISRLFSRHDLHELSISVVSFFGGSGSEVVVSWSLGSPDGEYNAEGELNMVKGFGKQNLNSVLHRVTTDLEYEKKKAAT
jgi:hypothetical protein